MPRTGPTAKQQRLADTDDVKLRLGVVAHTGKQKGVDSLIVTDLIELARNHAISDAVLLSGDEDVRIGVQIAQTYGVRVHLLGIEPPYNQGNQSRLLRQESDTLKKWGRSDVEAFLAIRELPESLCDEPRQTLGGQHTSTAAQLDGVADSFVHARSVPERSALAALGARQPIPDEFDRVLLRAAADQLGRFLESSERIYLRDAAKRLSAISPSEAPPPTEGNVPCRHTSISSTTEISHRFAHNHDVEHILMACEWLSDIGASAVAVLWREGVPPSIAPERARILVVQPVFCAPCGAMEGGTPSLRGLAAADGHVVDLYQLAGRGRRRTSAGARPDRKARLSAPHGAAGTPRVATRHHLPKSDGLLGGANEFWGEDILPSQLRWRGRLGSLGAGTLRSRRQFLGSGRSCGRGGLGVRRLLRRASGGRLSECGATPVRHRSRLHRCCCACVWCAGCRPVRLTWAGASAPLHRR